MAAALEEFLEKKHRAVPGETRASFFFVRGDDARGERLGRHPRRLLAQVRALEAREHLPGRVQDGREGEQDDDGDEEFFFRDRSPVKER